MISFRAHKHSDINIGTGSKVRDYSVNFVEFNPFDKKDLGTLKKLSSWEKGKSLARKICRSAKAELIRGEQWHKFYGLVEKCDSFEKIQPKKVLGVMDICPLHERLHELNIIQVNPKDNLFSTCRRYTEVGTAMIDSLKTLFPLKDIIVEPVEDPKVLEFYVKNGFQNIGDGLYKFCAKIKP